MPSVRDFKKELSSIIDTHATILSFAYAQAAAKGGKELEQVKALYQESNERIKELLAGGFKPKGISPKQHFNNLRTSVLQLCEEQEKKVMSLLDLNK
jgi:hypothetical protein